MSRLDELSKVVIPFGKYKGQVLDKVPLDYLDWVMGNVSLENQFAALLAEYLRHPTIAAEIRDLGIGE